MFIFIYLFLAVPGLCCCMQAFSNCRWFGLLSSCSVWASHRGGPFCCGAWALGAQASGVMACWPLSTQASVILTLAQ